VVVKVEKRRLINVGIADGWLDIERCRFFRLITQVGGSSNLSGVR
jgi:hypothetical protein